MKIEFYENDEIRSDVTSCEMDFVPQLGSIVVFNHRGGHGPERYRVVGVEHHFRSVKVKIDGAISYEDVLDTVMCIIEDCE